MTGFALDSSVFWPFYPIFLSDSELQHSLKVGRRVCIEHGCNNGKKTRIVRGTEVSVVGIRNKHAELRSRREGR